MRALLLLLFVYCKTVATSRDIVPAFLIDYDQTMRHLRYDANPFSMMSSTDFGDIIHEAIKRSDGIIMFVEDGLCSEDISVRDKLGTPFYYLRQGLVAGTVKYFPAVTEPYQILNQIFQPHPFNVFYLNIMTKLQLQENFKYIYVFFQDGKNETRAQALRRHDLIMREVYFFVRQFKAGPIVAFYTGKYNPVVIDTPSFVPIEPLEIPEEQSVMIRSDGALFRFRDVYTLSFTRRSNFKQVPVVAEESWEINRLSTKMAYIDFELQFDFEFEWDKWTLDSVVLLEGGEEVGRTDMGVCAPWHWSYVCGEPLIIINTRDGSSVVISEYQIQPLSDKETENNATGTSFGQAVKCDPYFNSHILAGLFVTFICLLILAFGLLNIYDCSSNDRFDDPNWKNFNIGELH